ncbi:MAG: AmmeMemoRadiSam system protein A [Bacilli bacterium]
MSIIAGFVVPHAPILVSEVGKGEEHKVQKTVDSYLQVAKDIASIKPDTIIISSPHAECYSDYFSFCGKDKGHATLTNFQAPQCHFDVDYDTELTSEIAHLASSQEFPAGTLGGNDSTDFTMDHGSMVPLYFINQFYKAYKLVRVGISGLSYSQHYQLGLLIQKAIEKLGRRAVYVASGDLSHCQKKDGPYGYKEVGPKYDQSIMNTLKSADFKGLLEYDPELVDEAEVCGHSSFAIMAGALDQRDLEVKVLSHEDTFGIGYGIVKYYVRGIDEKRNLVDQYKTDLVKKIEAKHRKADPFAALAIKAVNYYVTNQKPMPLDENIEKELLNQKAGVFVSIHEEQRLRGCIGTIMPTKANVALEIISNSASASSFDSRFDPIKSKELPYIDISVDVLSPFEKISSKEMLNPKKYGVFVKKDNSQGILLPDLEGVDTVDEQISIAKRKAGIPQKEAVELYRFTTTRHV